MSRRGTLGILAIAAVLAIGGLWGRAPAGAADPPPMLVELELLLAVDVSSSVDDDEYALQVHGLADALRDPDVQTAIGRVGRLGMAVAVVQWAGGADQRVALDWAWLTNGRSVDRFAQRVARMPRYFDGGDTRIGKAVLFSSTEVARNGIASRRQVIDVSGDGGAENLGLTRWARDAAVDQGMIINGLAIENEVEDLEVFFRNHVIGGSGAFVIRAAGYADFTDAMRRKLLREISDREISLRGPAPPSAPMRPGRDGSGPASPAG